MCLPACEYKSFLKSLVVSDEVKFNLFVLVGESSSNLKENKSVDGLNFTVQALKRLLFTSLRNVHAIAEQLWLLIDQPLIE